MKRDIKPRGNAYYIRLHHHIVSIYAPWEEKFGAENPWQYWIILPDHKDTPTDIITAVRKIYNEIFERKNLSINFLGLKGINKKNGLWEVIIEIKDREYLFWIGQVPLKDWQKDPSTKLD